MNDKRTEDENNTSKSLKPDSETLHKTDPQENMKGPLSSLMHNTGEEFKTDKTQEEADQKRDEHM
jgi:predicted AAA+ superfamily ATPase